MLGELEPIALRWYLKMALLSVSGGILVAVALLNIVSAEWKNKIKTTIRIKLGKSRR